MSGSPAETASTSAARSSRDLSYKAYGIGAPALQSQMDAINGGLATGEPGYMKNAFAGQRVGLTEGLASQMGGNPMLERRGDVTNAGATITPTALGAQLARAMMSSRLQEGMANVEQTNNLLNMKMGASGTAGNAALGAAANELRGIGGMQNYNPTYAGILGAANLAGNIYGGGARAGYWGPNSFNSVSGGGGQAAVEPWGPQPGSAFQAQGSTYGGGF